MARKDKFIKSKSIYTIKTKHAETSNGTVYENDYVTILPNDGIYDDEMALFSESNFKFRIRTNTNEKKRHVRSEFVDGTSGDTWTKEGLSAHTVSDESNIVLKPNYTSLKDFAYYGSAVELIRATVNDVVMRFPGGLSYYGENAPQVNVNGKIYYLVSNEFKIDCWTGGGDISSGSVENPMRVLAASYRNYENATGGPITCPAFTPGTMCYNAIIGQTDFGCGVFDVYMDGNGEKYLITPNSARTPSVIIRPKQEIIDEYWNTMDDFEKVLLDRTTTPIYKATFETPYFNENGYFYSNKTYVWPNIGDGFTPDITTGKFQGYLQSLISLAMTHDEIDSDNIWRMMTHESIKNMDWTLASHKDETERDTGDMDTSRISAMLRICGRQADDLKRYADNIKASNAISYDEKGNTPDYFLSDNVEDDGWIAKNVAPFGNVVTSGISTNGETVTIGGNINKYFNGVTPAYVNSAFMRRLALSSNYIQSMKGTRRGIEAILGMFGYEPCVNGVPRSKGDFQINEYIALVTGDTLDYCTASNYRALGEYVNYDENSDFMDGYPVKTVYHESGEKTDNNKYIVPWFDHDADYRYPMYFQAYGGWGKRENKAINLPSLTDKKEIGRGDTVDLYDETLPYMRFAATISEMLSISDGNLSVNTVCYVTDISEMLSNGYSTDSRDNGKTDYSHYFVLKNTALSSYMGYVNNSIYQCYGWRNVYQREIAGHGNTSVDIYEDGLRVLYMESLSAEENGNNPHVGFGNYDGGAEYIERYRYLFRDAVNDGLYDYLSKESASTYNAINSYGFKVNTDINDDRKINFFKGSGKWNVSEASDGSGEPAVDWKPSINVKVCNQDTKKDEDGIGSPLSTPCSYSIINVKKLQIKFFTDGDSFLKRYIQDVVTTYLREMVPSTSILEYAYVDDKGAFSAETRTAIPIMTTISEGRVKKGTVASVWVDNRIDGDNLYYTDDKSSYGIIDIP